MTAALNPFDVYEEISYYPHPGQMPVLRSPARMRVVSAGRRFGKSDLGGHELVVEACLTRYLKNELKERGKRREFWIVGPEYCVDADTEILTRRGWLRYTELTTADDALGQNPDTGLAEWTPVEKVNVFSARKRRMIRSVFRGHDSLTTRDHRWLTAWGKPGLYRVRGPRAGEPRFGYRWTTSEQLSLANEEVSCAAPVTNLPTEAKYTDAMVELVAWYYTEGSRWGAGLTISQKSGPNLQRIEASCQSAFGDRVLSMRSGSVKSTTPMWRSVRSESINQGGVALNGPAASEILDVCPTKAKIPTPEFIANLTAAQLRLFVEVSILADADSDWAGESVEFCQNVEARCDVFQMAAQLAGYRTTKVTTTNEYGPWWRVSLYRETKGAVWGGATYAAHSREEVYSGHIWCPTTGTGTWLARRNGRVFFTGNTDSEKEFRVLWNELSKLQIPFDRPGSYNNPEGGFMHLSLWDGTFQVHAKSAKMPDTLVGEGLHGVVLAEAAKLKERVWIKFIRPMLADFNGWALMTSTPEGKNWFYNKWQDGQNPHLHDWSSWRVPSWMNPHVYKTPTKGRDVRRVLDLQRDPRERRTAGEIADELGLLIDAEILSFLNDLTPEAFLQEIGADFTEFVGRVFKEFDEEWHVGDLEFNRSYQHYAAMDSGYTNPSVWLYLQVDPWGNIDVLDEIYQTGLTPDDFAALIQERGLHHHVLRFYPDPAAPGDNVQVSRALKIPSGGGTGGELQYRIDAIREALKPRKLVRHLPHDHPERLPRLRIDRRCVNTIREFQDYRYPERKDTILGNEAHEKPMKKDDHTPEALGRFFAGHVGTPDRSGGTRNGRGKIVSGTKRRM